MAGYYTKAKFKSVSVVTLTSLNEDSVALESANSR
jgi:hypothetical protein